MSDQHDFSPVRALDENGLPVPGARAFFYVPGTNAPRDVFADEAETILHPSPLLASNAGVFPAIWCSELVKCTVTDPSGVVLPGYPMQIAMRSFGGGSAADSVSFSPTVDITADTVQDAIEESFTKNSDRLDGLGDLAALDTITADQVAAAAKRLRAEGVATPTDNEFPTVLAMTGHVSDVAALRIPRTAGYVNTTVSIATGPGLQTFTHGLGGLPALAQFFLLCTSAEHGYAVGDYYGPISAETFADGANYGLVAAMNATQIKVRADILGMLTTSGTRVSPTPANWSLVIRLWA